VLLKAAGFIVTTIIAVLLVVANNIGTDANQALLLAAALLGVVLLLILLTLVAKWVRGRRSDFVFGSVSTERPSLVDPAPEPEMETEVEPIRLGYWTHVDPAENPRPARERPTVPAVSWKDMSPEQAHERDAIQHEARKVRDHYRAMTRVNQIADQPSEVKRSMQDRIDALNERLVAYREKWGMPDMSAAAAAFFTQQPMRGPAWLDAMVRELDAIVWQLDDRFE